MISRLAGTLTYIDLRYAIIDVGASLPNSTTGAIVGGSIGYKIALTEYTLEKISHQIGQHISFWTYLAVREDALDLYGFLTKEELDLFEHLISVSGIGPRSGLAILNGTTIDALKEGIASGDPSHLTKISGIGKKSAEKIILELRDKFADYITSAKGTSQEGSFAIEALVSLGYAERNVREVLKKLPALKTSQEIVKEAIKILSQQHN